MAYKDRKRLGICGAILRLPLAIFFWYVCTSYSSFFLKCVSMIINFATIELLFVLFALLAKR